MITITIEPDTESIHNFIHDRVLPNECFKMTGMLEIKTPRPVQIKQLLIRFKGIVRSILSTTDLHDSLKKGNEMSLERWNTREPTRFIDKLTRSALGQTQVQYILIDEWVVLDTQILPLGKTRLPFCLTINRVHCLPPSIFLPHHVIRYDLSATIKLEKLAFKTKFESKVNIALYKHAYPSIHSLDLSRIRYQGSRKNFLKYEISMPKFTCLQSLQHDFTCEFDLLRRDSVMQSIEIYLEQTELYPIRAGNYNAVYQVQSETLIARRRRFSRTRHDMQNYENRKELVMSVSLDLPHISPCIDTSILKITHQLQLLIRFKEEKSMSLSFPLSIGTVPIGVMAVRPQPNQWIPSSSNDALPSYSDVIKEGNPPSPFLENI